MRLLGIVCILIGLLAILYILALMKSCALPDEDEKWVEEYLKERKKNESNRSDNFK